MQVLVTGAFGNIGHNTVEALLARGHSVRCFDLDTPANRLAALTLAKRYGDRVDTLWGDLRRPDDVAQAVEGQQAVAHLAFLVPKLSATGQGSEDKPDLAWAVNVDGTHNLLNAMRAQSPRARIVFTSSLHVYGPTQHLPAVRSADDPVHPVEHYARHKVACEWLVKASGLEWTILRFAAAFPFSLKLDPYMFHVPLANRMEFIHTRDAATAVANAVGSDEVWGKTLLIGGGPRCQLYYGEIVKKILGAVGVGMLPADAFGTTPFATDWLDTAESERLLHYQEHTLDDWVREFKQVVGLRRWLIWLGRPIVRAMLLRQSPFWQATHARMGRPRQRALSRGAATLPHKAAVAHGPQH